MVLTWSKVEVAALSQSEATQKKNLKKSGTSREPLISLRTETLLPADIHFPFHPFILTHSHFALQLYSPHSLFSSLLRQIFAVVFFFFRSEQRSGLRQIDLTSSLQARWRMWQMWGRGVYGLPSAWEWISGRESPDGLGLKQFNRGCPGWAPYGITLHI